MTYVYLFLEFVKTGLFSVGGGLATLPFLASMADRYPWFDRALLGNMVAIAESTPGPIGINMATYAGFMGGGVGGGVLASLALVLPSFVIVTAVARFLDKFMNHRLTAAAFYGLRPCVAALITWAGLDLSAAVLTDPALMPNVLAAVKWPALILFILCFAALKLIKRVRPWQLFAAAAAVGAVFRL